MAMWVGYAALQFPMYKSLRRWLEDVDRRHRPFDRLLDRNGSGSDNSSQVSSQSSLGNVKKPVTWTAVVAGGAAGAFATIVTYPLDWVRTRFASQGVPRVSAAVPCRVATNNHILQLLLASVRLRCLLNSCLFLFRFCSCTSAIAILFARRPHDTAALQSYFKV